MLVVRTLPKRLVICALSLQLLYLPVTATGAEKLSAAEAARLLQQASFGPTLSDIQAAGQFTAEQWIDWQLSLPATTHADKIETLPEQKTPVPLSRLETWWRIALTAPDQLRQRVAFALSEILVVSDQGNGLNNRVIALANYYDLLLAHSFGNYRDLQDWSGRGSDTADAPLVQRSAASKAAARRFTEPSPPCLRVA